MRPTESKRARGREREGEFNRCHRHRARWELTNTNMPIQASTKNSIAEGPRKSRSLACLCGGRWFISVNPPIHSALYQFENEMLSVCWFGSGSTGVARRRFPLHFGVPCSNAYVYPVNLLWNAKRFVYYNSHYTTNKWDVSTKRKIEALIFIVCTRNCSARQAASQPASHIPHWLAEIEPNRFCLFLCDSSR